MSEKKRKRLTAPGDNSINKLCTERAEMHHNTMRFEKNNVRVLELNVSPKFALMKQVVLDLNSIHSTVSSSHNDLDKCF